MEELTHLILHSRSESIILPAQRYDRFLINCRDYHYTCGFTDSKLSYEHVKRAIITATNMSKKARPIVLNSGIYDVILYPQVSGALIHEVIGHLCESDIFLESKRDYFLLGDDLNNPLITVYDDPSVKSGWGSIKMDDEGNIPKKVCMIKNGIVTGFLTNEKTADILSVPNNARARCQDYEHLPLVRMTNTIMEKGSDDVTEIIHNLDKGIICITSIGAVLHGDTWELIVSEGILVEGQNRRRITNFRIKGTVLDVIKKITKVSKQRETVSGFYCRKKHQDIPVSVTTPFLMVNDVSVEQC